MNQYLSIELSLVKMPLLIEGLERAGFTDIEALDLFLHATHSSGEQVVIVNGVIMAFGLVCPRLVPVAYATSVVRATYERFNDANTAPPTAWTLEVVDDGRLRIRFDDQTPHMILGEFVELLADVAGNFAFTPWPRSPMLAYLKSRVENKSGRS